MGKRIKILDDEVVDYLKDHLTEEEILVKQRAEMKEFVIDTLEEFLSDFKHMNYCKLKDKLLHISGSYYNDEMGVLSFCINKKEWGLDRILSLMATREQKDNYDKIKQREREKIDLPF